MRKYKYNNKIEMFSAFYTMSTIQVSRPKGSLTIAETETDTDKMATGVNGISVSVQYEHLQKIYARYFLSVSVLISISVNAPYIFHNELPCNYYYDS